MPTTRVCLLALAVLAMSSPLLAQRGRSGRVTPLPPAFVVVAGASPYDLAGTGTGPFGSVRIEAPVGRFLVIEPGVTVFRYTSQADEKVTLLFTEIAAQLQVPSGPVRPYVGAGIGFSEFLSGRGGNELLLHAATGLRVPVGGRWGLRAEARIRSVDPFHGNTFDLGFGISRAFGPNAR